MADSSSFLGQGLTDLTGIFGSSGPRRRIVQQQPGATEFDPQPYGWDTQYGVDPASGLPIIPGSPYGPPPPISPSDRFNVKNTMEETDFSNPLDFVPKFAGNLYHGLQGAITGLGGLIGMAFHDTLKTLAPLVPGEQKIEDDPYKLYEEFLVPALGIGSAKSNILEDWKYRYGFTEHGFDLGRVGRGIYEQPFSLLNDALMVGGAVGSAAKAAATSRFGEAAFAASLFGEDAVAASKAAYLKNAASSASPMLVTEAQKAAMAAGTRPAWLTRAMDIAALTADDKFLGALKSKTFEMPVGPNDLMFRKPLSSNPVARGLRVAVYKSPLLAQTFDSMDRVLKGYTGGYGYDAYVERLAGGSFGTGINSPAIQEAFANLGEKAPLARELFRKMQRMVEDTSEAVPQSFKYNKVFRTEVDHWIERRWFNAARSNIAAQGMQRRKYFEGSIVKIKNKAIGKMSSWFGEAFDEPTSQRLLVNTAQGMLDNEALLARSPVRDGATQYPGLAAPPAEWLNLTDNPPPAVGFEDGNIYNYDRVIKPVAQALDTGARQGFLEKAGGISDVVQEVTINFPSGPRRVVSMLVENWDDMYKAIDDAATSMGGKPEWYIDHLHDAGRLMNDQRLIRGFTVGVRLPDGSLVELMPSTRHGFQATIAASKASKLLFGLLDDFEGYAGEGAILDNQYAKFQAMEAETAQLKSSLATLTGEDLAAAERKIFTNEARAAELRNEFGRNLEVAQALQRNIADGYEFIKTQLNEGIDRSLQYGPDYNPMWEWRDDMSVTWWNQVLEEEMTGAAAHPAALDFSTHMNRVYKVRLINKIYKTFNEFGHDLKRFLDGDFIDEIGRMSPSERLAFAQALGVSSKVAQSILAGDLAAVRQFFTYTDGITGAASREAALAARVSAFMHMNHWPTAAVQDIVGRMLSGIEKGVNNTTVSAVRGNLEAVNILQQTAEEAGKGIVGKEGISILDESATLDGVPLWNSDGSLNTSVAAQAIKRYTERKIGGILEEGTVPGFRWRDLHEEWHVQQGMPTPIYFPHMPKPAAGSMHMSLGSSLSTLHPRETWLRHWDGDLLKRGIYDKNFLEVWAQRAVQIIRHQEVIKLFEEAKRYSRKVSPRELDLWEAGWMEGEKLWNPKLLDISYRLSKQMHQTITDLVDEGRNIDEAADMTIKEIMPDAFAASLRVSEGELYAVPSHIAQKITYATRLNMPWFVRMFYDGPMQVWRTSVLAFSPRWITNNTFGNTIFQLIKDPKAIYETIRMFDRDYRTMWSHIGGGAFPEGVDRGLFFEQGNIIEAGKYGYGEAAAPKVADWMRKKMSTKTATILSKKAEWMRELNGSIEDAARRGVFASEYKSLVKRNMMATGERWVSNAQVMEKIMKNGLDGEMAQKALTQVNKVLGDYTNLNPFERQIVRRFVLPFYAFWKHSVKFVLAMPFENPYKVAIMRQMDMLEDDMWGDDMPDWFSGSVFIGKMGQSDPLWIRTRNMNPIQGALNPSPTGIVASFSPWLRAIMENQMGINTFTGEKFSSADTFETPTGQLYRYVRDGNGKLIGVRLLGPDEKVTPSWFQSFLSMWPQIKLIQEGIIDPATGNSGARYSATGDTIMEGGVPKYPTPMGAAWASFFGFPMTTFDPSDYLYRQYSGYYRSALPMAQSRIEQQTGQPVQMGVQMP